MTAVPCKSPKVVVELHPMAGPEGARERHVVICRVPGCDFGRVYHVVKVAANEEARWHRNAHRAAVPKISVNKVGEKGGFVGDCSCGFQPYDGAISSRQSIDQALTYHLSREHGLVTC